ncbi:MAG: alpha/beta hydrolase [Planctomycetota bacterium]|nr:alpha/beta hydrolase [Planctomycetota bacterium]
MDGNVTVGSFTASDGMRVEYFTHGSPNSPVLLISPALSGSAAAYAHDFGAGLRDYFVVAVQLRGHGTGGGCTYDGAEHCSQAQSPKEGVYGGFRMSRLAADLKETWQYLGLAKAALLGHSMGMSVVAELISNNGTKGITGLVVYDQSPVNMDIGVPENSTFPADIQSTYPFLPLVGMVESYPVFETKKNYVNVRHNVKQMLGGEPVLNPCNPKPAFVLTEEAWLRWAEFADGINGKVLSTLLWNTLSNDYSDVYRVVAQSGMPVLVYGGKSSIVPWRAMQWVSEQVPDSEFMLFEKEDGVHAPHLSPPPLREKFMNGVLSFLDCRVRPKARG